MTLDKIPFRTCQRHPGDRLRRPHRPELGPAQLGGVAERVGDIRRAEPGEQVDPRQRRAMNGMDVQRHPDPPARHDTLALVPDLTASAALPGVLDLGLDGLRPFDCFTSPEAWPRLVRALAGRPFLRSEGMAIVPGPPHLASGPLLAGFRDTVARFDRFYRAVIAAYYAGGTELVPDPMFARMLDAERAIELALPLTRLDLVITEDGTLRAIELNSVGVCTHHIRTAAYLGRELARLGWADDARRLAWFYDEMVASIRRAYLRRAAEPVAAPRIAVLYTSDMFRASRVLWRDAFTRRGFAFVACHADELELGPGGVRARGAPVDVVWSDYLFFFGYQQRRYAETRFPSRFGDFSRAQAEAVRILDHPDWPGLIADGRVVCVSPAQAYLAWSKHLLSWIHRGDRPVPEADRAWLADHVARTWSASERIGGALALDEAVRRRDELLIKPCSYGGSHGVLPGCEASAADWARRLDEIWTDPAWVVQAFHPPRRTADGQFLSLGLYSYGGRLGGITLRTGPSRNVSARDSVFIPAVADDV
jgi:hypothetical protein